MAFIRNVLVIHRGTHLVQFSLVIQRGRLRDSLLYRTPVIEYYIIKENFTQCSLLYKMFAMQELIAIEGLKQDFKLRYDLDLLTEYGKLYPEKRGSPTSEELGDMVAQKDADENAALAILFEGQEPVPEYDSEEEDISSGQPTESISDNLFGACGLEEEVNLMFYILSFYSSCLP